MRAALALEPDFDSASVWLVRDAEDRGEFGRAAFWRRAQSRAHVGPADVARWLAGDLARLTRAAEVAGQPIVGPEDAGSDEPAPR
jgi:hypothetical protein